MKFCKQKQDSWGSAKQREQKLSAPFFVIQPASQAARREANTMTMQFDISGGDRQEV
jgi:hypothetical protein